MRTLDHLKHAPAYFKYYLKSIFTYQLFFINIAFENDTRLIESIINKCIKNKCVKLYHACRYRREKSDCRRQQKLFALYATISRIKLTVNGGRERKTSVIQNQLICLSRYINRFILLKNSFATWRKSVEIELASEHVWCLFELVYCFHL